MTLTCLLTATPAQAENAASDASQNLSELTEFVKNLEIRNAIYGQYYLSDKGFEDALMGLHEGKHYGEGFEFDYGIRLQKVRGQTAELGLNNVSYNQFAERYDFRIGKMVERIGVMDYLSNINALNPLNYNHYDEPNINVRYQPTYMARFNWYPNAQQTASVFFKPFNPEDYKLSSNLYQYGLNIGVPFLLTNSGDQELNLVGERILLPVYQDNGKAAVSDYLQDNWPDTARSAKNAMFGYNHLWTQDNYTFGASIFSGLAQFPKLGINQELLDDLAALDSITEQEAFLDDYFAGEDAKPIVSVEFVRFTQAALYYETTYEEVGIRGEFSYRDKLPLLNRTTNQYTLGLGLDHKGVHYSNIELQYAYYQQIDLSSLIALWVLQAEPWHYQGWEIQLQNFASYIWVEGETAFGNMVKFSFERDNLLFSIEHLVHNKEEYVPATTALRLRVLF